MLLEWWSGTECTIYTDPRAFPKYGKENAIVVLNHKFEIDFLCGWSLAERFGILGVSGRGCLLARFSGSDVLLVLVQKIQQSSAG